MQISLPGISAVLHVCLLRGLFCPSNLLSPQVHVDVVGPLLVSQGFSCLLTFVNCLTRWPEAIPLSLVSLQLIVLGGLCPWMASLVRCPVVCNHTRQQFISSLWSDLASSLGSSLGCTTPYHPQAKGLVE